MQTRTEGPSRGGGVPLAATLLVWGAAVLAGQARDSALLQLLAHDSKGTPVQGALVQVRTGSRVTVSVSTDSAGRAEVRGIEPGRYDLAITKDGFEPVDKKDVDLSDGSPLTVELTLVPAMARRDSVEVKDTASPVERGATVPEQAPTPVIRELPGRPATVTDTLPLLPGIVRTPGGGLVMSAAGEHRSALIVNSADVTDPATGQFGLTVPIDSVETVNVYQTPFLAEFGRFTAGLVSVQTRRGGDHWKWDLNDPFPDFRIRSYRLRGLRDATPRFNLEGPLIPGKLYFSEGLNYEIRKTEVYELPFPNNQKVREGWNSFAQLDWIASSRHLVTATVHVAPQHLNYVNMDYFNPQPTTPEASTQNYTATVSDKLSVMGGLLENTLSVTRFDARIWGQGTQDFTMAPEGNGGSYFAQQGRRASRLSWTPTYSFASWNRLGTHNFKLGAYVAETGDRGEVLERPIDLFDGSGGLLERIQFTGGQPFRMSDTEMAFFGQDHWMISPHLAVDLGVRTESQELSESFRVAPRAGVAWSPLPSLGTVIRAGFGLFYDRVPLNVYSFESFPSQLVTLFDGGVPSGPPILYQNGLGTVYRHFAFVFQEPAAGNFSPHSDTGSVQIEQPLTQRLRLRMGYVQSQSSGLVILNRLAPTPGTFTGANILSGDGQSRYHQFEATARLRWDEKRQLFFSYVRSRARGDLNDFATYLGSFAAPVLRPNQFGNLPADLPNRFLAWGMVQLPLSFRIAPLVEYRSGFPYTVTDAMQNWVGVPNANRFPGFLSVDARVSKDIRVNPKYAVRLSVSGYNLTNHFNPEAVHSNAADPVYGFFFGQRGRRFTADFDVIF